MTAEHYHALYRWFDAHPAARRFVVALDRWLPLVPFVCYPVLLCLLNVRLVQLFLTRQSAAPDLMSEIARSILVPGITFWVGTALRARLDRPRPYDQPGFTPLVQKDTHGRSFPSRHALSAAVLAMVWLYFSPAVGWCMIVIALLIAVVRVLTGVSILWFLVPGYVFAIGISFVVPKLFTAIAFDAGGVASGPMTATFLLPLAQGACVAVGGNIVTDAFGVVAMVAMTPLITVQMMGLVAQLRTRKARTAQPAAVLATVFADLPDDAIIEL